MLWTEVFLFFSDEMEKIKIPKDMEDAKALGIVLSKYKDTYYTQVLVAYFATYVLYPKRNCLHIYNNLTQLYIHWFILYFFLSLYE